MMWMQNRRHNEVIDLSAEVFATILDVLKSELDGSQFSVRLDGPTTISVLVKHKAICNSHKGGKLLLRVHSNRTHIHVKSCLQGPESTYSNRSIIGVIPMDNDVYDSSFIGEEIAVIARRVSDLLKEEVQTFGSFQAKVCPQGGRSEFK